MHSLGYLRLISFLTVLLTLPLGLPVGASQGDSFATAKLIQKGTYHYVLPVGADHYFKIQLAPREWIFATLLSPQGSDFDLYLYGPNQLEMNRDRSSDQFNWVGGGKPENIVGGTYYIKVEHYSGPSGEYELWVGPTTIASGSHSQSICEEGRTYYVISGEAGWAAKIDMTQPPVQTLTSIYTIQMANPSHSLQDLAQNPNRSRSRSRKQGPTSSASNGTADQVVAPKSPCLSDRRSRFGS